MCLDFHFHVSGRIISMQFFSAFSSRVFSLFISKALYIFSSKQAAVISTLVTAMRVSFRSPISHFIGRGQNACLQRSHVLLCGLSDKMLDLWETISLGHL